MKVSHIMLLICLPVAAGSGAGCTSGEPPDTEQVGRYFDFPGYFAREIGRLESSGARLQKTVYRDQQEETQTFDTVDWERELARFGEVDINKPAWQESYRVDSAGGTLTYTATEPDLQIRKIRVNGEIPHSIRSVHIQKETKNLLYTSSEELVYHPDSAYSIAHSQQIRLLSKDDFKINGQILPVGKNN